MIINLNHYYLRSCIYISLLLLISAGAEAQENLQPSLKHKIFDPYQEYKKEGISSSDYKNDTLKLYFDENWEKHNKEGAWFYSIAYPANGGWTCEDYDLFEKKIVNYIVYADQQLTILNGPFYTFHFNGNAETIGQYSNDKKIGSWLTYAESGKLIDSTYYLNNGQKGNSYSFYSSGKIESIMILDSKGKGTYTEYYENGAMRQSGQYFKSNWKDSIWTHYYPDGKVSFVENYLDYEHPDIKCYDEQGNLKDTCETERMPEPGGDLSQFLKNTIRWPSGMRFADANKARVVARFLVDTDGSIKNIKIIKHVAKPFDDEVIRVIKQMPPWKPGLRYNQPVRVYYTLPVNFWQK